MKETVSSTKTSLTTKASKSAFWSLTNSVGVSFLRFISTAYLARILMPEDFGIVGMAYLTVHVVQLFGNLGMGAALIQRKEVDDEYMSTGYWTSIAAGTVLTIAGLAVSPLAGIFFKNPNVTPVLMVLSLNFLLSALASMQSVLLIKELQFKKLSLIEIGCTIIRIAVIILLAHAGYSYWSIAIGIVCERLAKTFIMMLTVAWRPKFIFHKEKFMTLFNYGKNLFGANFLGYFNQNMDYFVTGRALGAANLGYYQFAFGIPHLVLTHFAQKIHEVLFPIYSKVQGEQDRITRGYLKTLSFISMVTFPLMSWLGFAAEDFIVTAYGSRWLPSVVPLQILCLSAAIKSVNNANGTLFMSQGRPDISFKWGLFLFPTTVVTIIVFARWGIEGVAWGMTLLSLLSFIPTKIALSLIKSRFSLYFVSIWPASVGSALMLGGLNLIWMLGLFETFTTPLRLVASLMSAITIYGIVLFLMFREQFMELIRFVKKVFHKEKA